ncbi:MAG TPA: hypothetical protein VFC52_04485 [Solirubrobacterales bacterium]|nr:hypothetical protein [Solirubrobacterales bacterium]
MLKTLAGRWSGGVGWSTQSTPNPESGPAELYGVACPTAESCTAVGKQGSGLASKTLAQRWDGSSWSSSSTTNPAGLSIGLEDVSCTSSNACTAVGNHLNSSLVQTGLIERWNGSTWSPQSIALPSGSKSTYLHDVSCITSSACTAVGRYGLEGGDEATLVESWGGGEWAVQTSPSPEGYELPRFTGVACTSPSACTAVGWARKESEGVETSGLVARYE